MSGEIKYEIENTKEVFLEEVERVQSQKEFRNVRDRCIRKKRREYPGGCGILNFLQ